MFCSILEASKHLYLIELLLVKELKLAPFRQIHVEVSAFLNTEESNMKLSEYEIVVKSIRNDKRRVIAALGVPKRCSELKNQSCRIAVEK